MRILLVRHGESLGNVDKQIHETTATFIQAGTALSV